MDADIVQAFNREWYGAETETWKTMTWLGVPLLKNPCDLWLYQQLLWDIRPRWIIETGSWLGGSALYLASIAALAGFECEVISIDIEYNAARPVHAGIHYLLGDSADPATAEAVVQRVARAPGPRLVILDSDHAAPHVLAELRLYAPLVTRGSYLICEDCNLGREVIPDFGPGPAEAVEQWLGEQHLGFDVDRSCERLGLTWNNGGYLRRSDG
jgi:cephalosporin hydroxylase